ncbi:MAG: hypothetical protein OHK0015_31420 [Chloroflexi bacterium OHK40]
MDGEPHPCPAPGTDRSPGGTPAGTPPSVMPFYRDMELVCRNCGATFIFTAGEQEFYADKGFLHEPTRCPKCRSRRDAPREGDERPNRKESSARQQR